MRVRRLIIRNFRGVREGVVDFPKHALLVGGNNVGKSTVCDALDLVLGPERMHRRPVVDEHDFYEGRYIAKAGQPDPEIYIEVWLTDLSDEARRQFWANVRRWSEAKGRFVDEGDEVVPEGADEEGTEWILPVAFIGRYNREDDNFEGGTFLLHPRREVDDEERHALGAGLSAFTPKHKRLCGFVFLRALRTGARALTLQQGSLLDTVLRLAGDDVPEMWVNTLDRLRHLDPPIGAIPQLKVIQSEIEKRARRFVPLAPEGDASAFFPSDLTRETLREFVRLFVASDQNPYLLPFQRHGAGTINVLVFALLTFIADLKKAGSVIFAMEEPEIALPPHTQRRIVQFVREKMGQAIVTSHSPYVIEQFGHDEIVVLHRPSRGALRGLPIKSGHIKEKTFRVQRRQFAEAVLSRAVLVVEGGTEVAVCHAVSAALEKFGAVGGYMHLDLAGISVFNAGGQGNVPKYGPVFRAMEKLCFAFCDKPTKPWSREDEQNLRQYDLFRELPYPGIEDLLIHEVPTEVQRRFLQVCSYREDYPDVSRYKPTDDDETVRRRTREVLKARKGEDSDYPALLIQQCRTVDELPRSIVDILLELDSRLTALAATNIAVRKEPIPAGGT